MQDDYIEEDFLEEENTSDRRPFLMAVGVLVTLFILMGACTAFFLINNRAAEDRAAEVAAIETRNAETEASNAATAIAATDTAAAIPPTNTSEPTGTPTETAAPATATPTPTNTPVVETTEAEAIIETGDGEETGAADNETGVTGTEDGSAEGGTVDEDATPTPISALSETGDGSNGDALPQTGLDTWGVVLAAFVLVGLVVFARRLRTMG